MAGFEHSRGATQSMCLYGGGRHVRCPLSGHLGLKTWPPIFSWPKRDWYRCMYSKCNHVWRHECEA